MLGALEKARYFKAEALRRISQYTTGPALREVRHMLDRLAQVQIGGKSAAEHIFDGLSGLNGQLINHEIIAKQIGELLKDLPGPLKNSWNNIGYLAYKDFAQTINHLGSQLSEKALLGYLKFYAKLIAPDSHALVRFDDFIKYFTRENGTIDANALKQTLEAAKDSLAMGTFLFPKFGDL